MTPHVPPTEQDERQYRVRYQYATYSGERVVWALDEDDAIRSVKRMLAPHMSLSMAFESYHAELLGCEHCRGGDR